MFIQFCVALCTPWNRLISVLVGVNVGVMILAFRLGVRVQRRRLLGRPLFIPRDL